MPSGKWLISVSLLYCCRILAEIVLSAADCELVLVLVGSASPEELLPSNIAEQAGRARVTRKKINNRMELMAICRIYAAIVLNCLLRA